MKKLAESLLNDSNTGMIVNQKAITGMGGLGKTQLAVEFAYRYGRYYRGVHWLNLADPTLLDSEITRCGIEMALPNWPDDQPSQVTFTINSWKNHGPRLLILDNFEDVEKLNQILPRLRHSGLRLLITSRRTDWPSTAGLSSFPLELFSTTESLAFLKKALDKRKDQNGDLATLAERLGHLPLALELASRYLNAHPRLSVDGYLVQAKEAFNHPSMRDWRKDLPAPTQHDLDLQRTFALSWESIKDETAQKLFQMTGYLAPNTPIPSEIFEKALEISRDVCDETLNTLYGLGLLRQSENDQPTIHPLLSEYSRSWAKENPEILESLTDVLGTLSHDANNTGLPTNFFALKSHVPILAAYAESAELESVGVLWNNYGYYLSIIADFSGARTMFERALKIFEANLGAEHPNVAIRVNNLGMVMQAQGDLNGARAAFERALKIDEASFGPDHPAVATDVNNLGSVIKAQGDLNGARAAFERAVKIWEANLGTEHPQVAIGVNNLGMVMTEQGDLNGARAAYERALAIFKKFLPLDHPNIKTVQGNLDSLQ